MSDKPEPEIGSTVNNDSKTPTDPPSFEDEVLAVLEALEWDGDPISFICPKCRVDRARGHESNCEVAALLARARWRRAIPDFPETLTARALHTAIRDANEFEWDLRRAKLETDAGSTLESGSESGAGVQKGA